jgi:WD40 repeat protein
MPAFATFIDFSGTTRWTVDFPVSDPSKGYDENQGFSQDWRWFAYVTGSVDESGTYPQGGVVLHLMNLLSGEVRDITSLVPMDYLARLQRMAVNNDPAYCASPSTDCLAWAVNTLQDSFHSMAWSPDGKFLAFGAMIDGDSADIYVYDIDTGKIRRLEKGPGNAQSFDWSPDGQWVIYEDSHIPVYSPKLGGFG